MVEWHVSGNKFDDRKYVVGRLLPKLTGPAGTLVSKWKAKVFEVPKGVDMFLLKLSNSPLPEQALQDAFNSFQKFFEFPRMGSESIPNYLVREADSYETFLGSASRVIEELRKSGELPPSYVRLQRTMGTQIPSYTGMLRNGIYWN